MIVPVADVGAALRAAPLPEGEVESRRQPRPGEG
jgi:hypothetical protein